jgi:DNA-binding transcriptional regulator YdaS (Cro superfamily)
MSDGELSRGAKLLAAWIGDRQQQTIAVRLGVSPMQLNHWLHGRRLPNLQHAVGIEDATCGAVPARSWVER